jgi:acetokinase family protein
MPAPAAVGHRIVHGGPKLRRHCVIDDSVLRQLEAATAFAPLHIPSALWVIRFAQGADSTGSSAIRNLAHCARVPTKSFTLDGEAVVCGGDGIAIFEDLHRRGIVSEAMLYAFDLLEFGGKDLRRWYIPGRNPLSSLPASLASQLDVTCVTPIGRRLP